MGATTLRSGTVPPDSESARQAAYGWGSARLDEDHRWRKLSETSDVAAVAPASFHREVAALLGSQGYKVEEEPPETSTSRSGGHPPTIEGAVQGERNFQWDAARSRSKRNWVGGIGIAGVGCFALAGLGFAWRSPGLAAFFIPGIFLVITAAALFPNTRAFRSEMLWVVYEGDGDRGPVRFRVKSARVSSANLRTRHSKTRSVASYVEDPSLQRDARALAAQLVASSSGELTQASGITP
ncbi:MAG: hypothetical protein L3K15_07895 [Thermoplasmata archaeon]|nr:hypothetical protein [Thermoplasmata archaeon]